VNTRIRFLVVGGFPTGMFLLSERTRESGDDEGYEKLIYLLGLLSCPVDTKAPAAGSLVGISYACCHIIC